MRRLFAGSVVVVGSVVVGSFGGAVGVTPAAAAAGPEVIEVDQAIEVGDLVDVELNADVVAMSAVSDHGYWFAAADGGVFAFGDAPYLGSMGGVELNAPIVGMAATASGDGYWLVAADGGVFAFGDAPFVGSLGDVGASSPVIAVAGSPEGDAYAVLDRDGAVWRFPRRTVTAAAGEIGPAVALVWGIDSLDVVHEDGTIVRQEGRGHAPLGGPVDGRVVTAAATPTGGYRLAVLPDDDRG